MEKISMQGVPETMLQTLYARAAYSGKPKHKFYDAKAVEIVSKLDYDFSKAAKDSMMSNGVIARTILLDRMVEDFVRENPDGVVVNIACGLDTRFYRVDNGRILIVIEGLVMYLQESDVKQILSIISRNFSKADIIMETMSPWVMEHMKEKSIEATKAKFTWGLKSGKELKAVAPDLIWVKDVSLVEGMKEIYPVYKVLGKIPVIRNISNKLVVLKK